MSFWLPSRARRSLDPGVRRENENNPPPCCPLSFPPRKRGPRSRDGAAATARTSAQRAFCRHDAQALLKSQHAPCHGGHGGSMSFWLPASAPWSLGRGVRRENEGQEGGGPAAVAVPLPQHGPQRRGPSAGTI